MNQVGYHKLSVASIRDAIHNYKGPIFMGPPSIHCGQYAAYKAGTVCDASVFPAVYKGNGVWVDSTKGKGINTDGIAFK